MPDRHHDLLLIQGAASHAPSFALSMGQRRTISHVLVESLDHIWPQAIVYLWTSKACILLQGLDPREGSLQYLQRRRKLGQRLQRILETVQSKKGGRKRRKRGQSAGEASQFVHLERESGKDHQWIVAAVDDDHGFRKGGKGGQTIVVAAKNLQGKRDLWQGSQPIFVADEGR